MHRAILPDGEVDCASYEQGEHGVSLFDENEDMIAFVPYENLRVIIHADVYKGDDENERSIM